MSKPTSQDLTIADDAIATALAAVGEMMPTKLRDSLIYASDWCWMRRVDFAQDACPHLAESGRVALTA